MRLPARGTTEVMSLLVERARVGGEIRADADPADLLRALAGFTYFNTGPDWEASARRLIDILMDGLESRRPDHPRGAEALRTGSRQLDVTLPWA